MIAIEFSTLVESANGDPEFKIAARYWDSRLEITIGDEATELLVIKGRIVGFGTPGTFGDDIHCIRIKAAESDWAKMLDRCPPPGCSNVLSASGFSYEGNILDRAPYHAAVRRLIELMRQQVNGPIRVRDVADVERSRDDAVGRYIYVDIEQVQYRIYYEETGSGIPLLMQHTAGTDGRQWRHILENRDYQRDFRLIAYDLPYHGKSLPPTSKGWWAEEYRPNRQWYINAILAISRALELDLPVFMGCSIGGLLAPALAFECPEHFRSVIGVNGGFTRTPPPYNQRIYTSHSALGMQANTWFHPRVASDWKGASMMGLMAPDSPIAYQRESAWLYEQGAPPIFHGDALATMYEFDLSEEQAQQIDTSKIDVYLLTGEYDPFAIGGESERLARCIDGATFRLIRGAGHFAPSDNPPAFKKALDPVLREIAAKHR